MSEAPWPTIEASKPGPSGWRRLGLGPAEAHQVRTDLGGHGPLGTLRPLVSFVQVSDLHVTDAQSSIRAEWLDRLGDDDSPLRSVLGPIGTYRTQESLTAQVVEAMARRLRGIDTGPVAGGPIGFVVSTGDAADNAQANEVEAAIGLLSGGTMVVADSGDRGRWEGVGAADTYDPCYWHPDGTPPGEQVDRPRSRYGFPLVPGLLDAARRPFAASGVGFPWYPVHGNHDRLLAGTVAATRFLERLARSGRKSTALPATIADAELVGLLGGSDRRDLALLPGLAAAPVRRVTPDPAREPLSEPAWLAAHAGRSGLPETERTWYAFDAGALRALVLDTVDAEGGWQGSIGVDQLAWLEAELEAASERFVDRAGRVRKGGGSGRGVVIFSHHPLRCLFNDWSPAGTRRVLTAELAATLSRYPCLVAWVNGHTHTHGVLPHPRHPDLGGGWWEVTTASHVDWPQQARVLEIAADGSGQVVLACTVVDHAGVLDPDPGELASIEGLAGWSRALAANDWQRAGPEGTVAGRGGPGDRNVVLVCAGAAAAGG